jgi:hypothetical protein
MMFLPLARTHIANMPMPFIKYWQDRDLVRPLLPDTHVTRVSNSLVSLKTSAMDTKVRIARDAILSVHAGWPSPFQILN